MIGIIGALDAEIIEVLKLLDEYKIFKHYDLDYYLGRFDDVDVVISKSGVGKVSAAISTTLMIEKYQPDFIINIGSCGSIRKDILINSTIIGTRSAFFDVDIDGYEQSFDNEKIAFDSDLKLIEIANLLKDEKTYIGNIVSSDSFVYKDEQVDYIIKNFPEAIAIDMESTSILKTCKLTKTPCIVIRGVSDNTLDKENNIDFEKYLESASKKSAKYCIEFIKTAKNYKF